MDFLTDVCCCRRGLNNAAEKSAFAASGIVAGGSDLLGLNDRSGIFGSAGSARDC
jgi:hypothetical protein